VRGSRIGTRTPVLAHDGSDLAAALQTIRENGGDTALGAAIDLAFPGSQLTIDCGSSGRLELFLRQRGGATTLAAPPRPPLSGAPPGAQPR
jgi:predicted ATPase